MLRQPNQALGDVADLQDCPLCDGDGFQLEEVWMGGEHSHEHEVPCYACAGRGFVVELVCGRCGHLEHAHPEDAVHDHRICTRCGHDAPNYLWLPMGGEDQQKREETA